MTRYIRLSYPLDPNGPHPPAIPDPELKTLYTVEKDQASVHVITVASHTGTHIDTPQHVIKDGLSVHDFMPEDFIYTKPVLVELDMKDDQVVTVKHLEGVIDSIKEADIVMFKFDYGRVRAEEPERYSAHCPGFGIESARLIRQECPNLRAMGMDVSSVACIADLENTMAAHNVLLEGADRKFIIIEEMNLEPELTGLKEVRISPWLVKGMDSGPCSIIGIIDN